MHHQLWYRDGVSILIVHRFLRNCEQIADEILAKNIILQQAAGYSECIK